MKMLVTVAMTRYEVQCNEHILVQLFCKAFCTFLLLVYRSLRSWRLVASVKYFSIDVLRTLK